MAAGMGKARGASPRAFLSTVAAGLLGGVFRGGGSGFGSGGSLGGLGIGALFGGLARDGFLGVAALGLGDQTCGFKEAGHTVGGLRALGQPLLHALHIHDDAALVILGQ